MSRDKLRDLRLRKLKKKLGYNYENSTFYRDRFDRAGIKPADIQTLADFQRDPTMTSDGVKKSRSGGLDILMGCWPVLPLNKIVRLSSTSGTRGIPTLYTTTKHDIEVNRELHDRKLWVWGGRPGDIMLHASGLSMFTGGVPVIEAFRSTGYAWSLWAPRVG